MADEKSKAAKEYLLEVKLCDTHITNMLEDLDKLNAMVTKITSAWKDITVSGGGNQDKIGSAVSDIVDLKVEINEAIDNYVSKKHEIGKLLEKLDNPDQIRVLHLLYFGIWDKAKEQQYYPSWEEVAERMHMTARNAQLIHGRALLAVGELLME